MQFDGIAMRACISLLNRDHLGSRVQRIVQVSPHSIDLELWAGRSSHLVCSAEAEAACLFVGGQPPRRQETPGPLVGLLRRHLSGARLAGARQVGWDRVAELTFRARTELGDETTFSLWVETMGKHSNIILVRADGKVVDAVKRIGRSRSRSRQVLPGLPHALPPVTDDKLAPDAATAEELAVALAGLPGAPSRQVAAGPTVASASALVRAVSGIGPERARILLAQVAGATSFAALAAELASLAAAADAGDPVAAEAVETAFWQALAGQPGAAPGARDAAGATNGTGALSPPQRSLLAAASRAAARAAAEAASAAGRLAALDDPEGVRSEADAIMSSLPAVRVAQASATAAGETELALDLLAYNAAEDGRAGRPVTVTLAAAEDAIAQAQTRYTQYAKANRRRRALTDHLEEAKEREHRLSVLSFQLEQPLTPEELAEVASEAAALGVVAAGEQAAGGTRPGGGPRGGRPARPSAGEKRQAASQPRRAVSPNGYEVLVGRNNRQNDAIVKLSRDDDLWFHARGVAGAHVLLRRAGRAEPVPAADIEFAAGLAAGYSQARTAGSITVDYCLARHLRRERGAAPGFVTYGGETSIHAQPAQLPDRPQ